MEISKKVQELLKNSAKTLVKVTKNIDKAMEITLFVVGECKEMVENPTEKKASEVAEKLGIQVYNGSVELGCDNDELCVAVGKLIDSVLHSYAIMTGKIEEPEEEQEQEKEFEDIFKGLFGE